MWRWILAARRAVGTTLWAAALTGAALSPCVARASDQPSYSPPPAWAKPLPIPKDDGQENTPFKVLLVNDQTRLMPGGIERFHETATRILSPQGLGPVGAVSMNWDPDTQDLIIHSVRILRGDQVIDALAGGKKFLVLRRENNLELAMLDGRLTATIEPEGLQLGDILDIAYTVTTHDPALSGHAVAFDGLQVAGVAGRVYMSTSWLADMPVRWRVTDGFPQAPKLEETANGSDLTLDMTDVQSPKPPMGAPSRFQQLGTLEFSDFSNWAALSQSLAPLYDKAETLSDASPLKAEIAKIAAATPDPGQRLIAALRLVEDQTRYVFLGMNDGGLVPAGADVTWSRRFGDCKGKTVLLVALLRGLGIEAEPALVSTSFGDGMDERLPAPGWFDHVLVRAVVAGKAYWLDGTRLGDRTLDDLIVPRFIWALPVRSPGADLVRLTPADFTTPGLEENISIDASKGPDAPAPTRIENVFRGEYAVALRAGLSSAPRPDVERGLREGWTKAYPWLTIATVAIDESPQGGDAHVVVDGTAKLEWKTTDTGEKYYRVPATTLGADASFRREPGPHDTAPYRVAYPFYTRSTRRVVLPKDGDFVLIGSDIEAAVGGQTLSRRARIEGGVLTVESIVHTTETEFPFAEADAAGATLRDLATKDVVVAYRMAGDHGVAEPAAHAAASGPVTNIDAQKAGPDSLEGLIAAARGGDAVSERHLADHYARGDGVPVYIANATDWYSKAAAAGDAEAQATLGSLELSGALGPEKVASGADWLTKAAGQGDGDAANTLGSAYEHGAGVARDYATAMIWYRRASDAGDLDADLGIARLYYNGFGVPKDTAQSMTWVRKAADQGASAAQNELGYSYLMGTDVAQDYAQALVWLNKAAAQGNPQAENTIGTMYADGHGVPRDVDAARAWFDKSAAQNHPAAIYNIGTLYEPSHTDRPDRATAATWFKRAADMGYVLAQRRLGQLYDAGMGVPHDDSQAAAWFRKAADQGDVESEVRLAVFYGQGQGVTKDVAQMLALDQKAASTGNPRGVAALAALYLHGTGVPQDVPKAVDMFQSAAAAGDPFAELTVGQMYIIGHDVPLDAAQGIGWVRKAADQDWEDALLAMGKLYLSGQGGQKDPQQAAAWLRRAVNRNSIEAAALLGHMYVTGALGTADPGAGLSLLSTAAEAGNADAEGDLGYMYARGLGVPRDHAVAASWLQKAADQGLASAAVNAATIYLNDEHDPAKALAVVTPAAERGDAKAQSWLGTMFLSARPSPDYRKAVEWLQKAADQGALQAMFNVADLYAEGRGTSRDVPRAIALYRQSAEAGYGSAEAVLAGRYQAGDGVPKDLPTAAAWYQKAADQGVLSAQVNLAVMEAQGAGVPQDGAKAFSLLSKPAADGNPNAQVEVGYLYDHAVGVPQDFTQALTWYRKAADQGFARGETNVGMMYAGGRGVPRDDAVAATWFQKAAMHGDVSGERMLGLSYLNGRGVAADRVQAIVWLQKAAAQGDAMSAAQLQALQTH